MRYLFIAAAAALLSCFVMATPAAAQTKYFEITKKYEKTFGTTVSQKIGFHGTAPTAQRSGAAQAAVSATTIAAAAGANPTKAEYDAAVARINALTTLVNELRAALVAKGLIKGSS
jgi:hypothetical protein